LSVWASGKVFLWGDWERQDLIVNCIRRWECKNVRKAGLCLLFLELWFWERRKWS